MLATAALHPARSGAASLGQLNDQLNNEQAHQHSLSSSIASLNNLIAGLDSQIALVQKREAEVRAELAQDQVTLSRVQNELKAERKLLAQLRARLAAAQAQLAAQLVSGYENAKPDLVTVVLNAHGFNDLLDQIAYLGNAEKQQQTLITATRKARAAANSAARYLAKLQATDAKITHEAYLHDQALKGMNALLSSKEAALQKARSAQQAALAASRKRSGHLQSEISKIQAQQAAAQSAATSFTGGPGAGPVGRVGDPVPDRAVRVRRPEPAAQLGGSVGLLPDHPQHLDWIRRHRPGGLPDLQGRAGRGRGPDLEGRRRRVELGLRRDRRDPLSAGRTLVVALLLLAAFVVRVAYVEHTPFKAVNDAGTYNRLGSMIAQTGDYDTGSAPGSGAGGSRGPTAYFPPGYPYFISRGRHRHRPPGRGQDGDQADPAGPGDSRHDRGGPDRAGGAGRRSARRCWRWWRWRWPPSIRCSWS